MSTSRGDSTAADLNGRNDSYKCESLFLMVNLILEVCYKKEKNKT